MRIEPLKIVHNGQLHLDRLGSPPSQPTTWLLALLKSSHSDFLRECVARQRSAKKPNGERLKAPLAGVVVGNRQSPLYTAFFNVVKVELLRERQKTALTNGMKFLGHQEYNVGLQEGDFIDPVTVIAGEGSDVDLSSEAALLRLTQLEPVSAELFQGNAVQTVAQAKADKAASFAHAEEDLIPESLRRAVIEAEGLELPVGTNLGAALAAAPLITSDYLRGALLNELALAEKPQEAQVTYSVAGTLGFTLKKTPQVAPYKPYSKTPDDPDVGFDLLESESPFAGESMTGQDQTRPKAREVLDFRQRISETAMNRLLQNQQRLSALRERLLTDMEVALGDGDLSESSFYDETRSELSRVEAELNLVSDQLDGSVIGDVNTNIGLLFTLQIGKVSKTAKLVDGDPELGEISVKSKLGEALVNASAGDQFSISVPIHRTEMRNAVIAQITDQVVFRERHVPRGTRKPVKQDAYRIYELTPSKLRMSVERQRPITVRVISVDPEESAQVEA